MKTSLFEIRATMQKAATGSGLSTGLATDFGLAVEWLSAHGFDGVKAGLRALGHDAGPSAEYPADQRVIHIKNARIATCGPVALDILAAEDAVLEVHFLDADSSLLMLGYCGVLGLQYKLDLLVQFGDGPPVRIAKGDLFADQIPTESTKTLTLRRALQPDHMQAHPLQSGAIETTDHIWEQALVLAAKNYVPESNSSRLSGAGAGLTDND